MFKAPFSFEGRIRRTEYGLSMIIHAVIYFFTLFIIGATESFFILALLIPLFWFGLAQGAKRCHDLGNSGWFQLIPFYGLWMLFQNSDEGENKYGLNPKGIVNENSYDDQINEIGKSLES